VDWGAQFARQAGSILEQISIYFAIAVAIFGLAGDLNFSTADLWSTGLVCSSPVLHPATSFTGASVGLTPRLIGGQKAPVRVQPLVRMHYTQEARYSPDMVTTNVLPLSKTRPERFIVALPALTVITYWPSFKGLTVAVAP
jgi:hypothetical protein